MKLSHLHPLAVLLATFTTAPFALQAQPSVVPGVYGTGLDNSGALLSPGSEDSHYTIISGPSTGSTFVVGPALPGFWNPNGPTSNWISVNATASPSGFGNYLFRTTFDLSGYLPNTASMTGFWNTDDSGLEIILNGISFAFTTGNLSYRDPPSPFTISSEFVNGMNTLDFVLSDNSGAVGLRVDSLVVTAEAVPEPSTYALLLMTGAGALWLARRRR